MTVDAAYLLIARAIDEGRAAHGYLIVGDIRGNARELAELVLKKLFPDAIAQVEAGTHPDIVTLEPEGKGRIIPVKVMRERIVEPMESTSFSGGWKVGMIVGADRMKAEAANAFLKSLEEPTPKTLYLLLTDQPDAILPTIISRSQRIDLSLSSGTLEGEDYDEVAELFAAKDAAGLAAKFKDLKAGVEDADVALVRKAFFKTLMSFVREMLIGGRLERYKAFANVDAVEEAARRSEKSIGDELVLSYMLERISFPA